MYLSIQVVSHFLFTTFLYNQTPSSVRDDGESVPVFAHTRSPSDTFRPSSTQPVHAFASTSSDVAQQLNPQVQNSTPDTLPPPPRYTLDASQLAQGGNINNPIASKFNNLTLSSTPRNSG